MMVVGIWGGMVGATGIAACLYMAEHGYSWWQIMLMALLAFGLMPRLNKKETRVHVGNQD